MSVDTDHLNESARNTMSSEAGIEMTDQQWHQEEPVLVPDIPETLIKLPKPHSFSEPSYYRESTQQPQEPSASSNAHLSRSPSLSHEQATKPAPGGTPTSQALPNAEKPEYLEPKPWMKGQPYVFLEPFEGGHWATMQKGVNKHDDELCKGWKDDLDTMLVFTGLFSAAVTAFCIESFNSLSQDPADTTNALLLIISQQITNSSFTPIFTESIGGDFHSTTASVQINVLYFISLTLALSVSSVCILGKQWIREFQRDVAVSSRDAIRIRQARFDTLHAWKLPQILAALPVILQAALMLFFAGLLVQLWEVSNRTPATVVSIVVGLTIMMVLVTTIVPAHFSESRLGRKLTPFRSPQAWIYFVGYQQLFAAVFALRRLFFSIRASIMSTMGREMEVSEQPVQHVESWAELDIAFIKEELSSTWYTHTSTSAHQALRWIYTVLGNNDVYKNSVMWCLQEEYPPTGLIDCDMELQNFIQLGPLPTYFGTSWGRLRLELHFRDLNEQIRDLKWSKDLRQGQDRYPILWNKILDSFRDLRERYGLNGPPFPSSELERQKDLVYQQLALMANQMLLILPTDGFEAFGGGYPGADMLVAQIFDLARHRYSDDTEGPALQILESIITDTIPSAFQSRGSVPLLCALGHAAVAYMENAHPSLVGLQYEARFFRALDALLVEMCSYPDSVDGFDEWNIERWCQVREDWINIARRPSLPVPSFSDFMAFKKQRVRSQAMTSNPEHVYTVELRALIARAKEGRIS